MEKLDMAKINMLLKKGYLLAGMMMAADMFVGNEMRAMENEIQNNLGPQIQSQVKKKKENILFKNGGKKAAETQSPQSILSSFLSLENTINLIGGLALSGANYYFKWWDYTPGTYRKLGCIGWRSKRLLDIFQFEVNLNLGRGISWSIPHIINFKRILTTRKTKGKKGTEGNKDTNSNAGLWVSFLNQGILPGFVSMPLTFHFSKFSISISLDSIIWSIVGMILDKKDGKKLKEIKLNEGEKKQNQFPEQLINESYDTEAKKNPELMTKEEELTEEQKK